MPRVVKRSAAADDLLDHYVYIGVRNSKAADEFLAAAEQALQMIAEAPHAGSERDLRNAMLKGIRICTIAGFRKYVIYYRIIPDGIEAIRILHGSRRVVKLLLEGLES